MSFVYFVIIILLIVILKSCCFYVKIYYGEKVVKVLDICIELVILFVVWFMDIFLII